MSYFNDSDVVKSQLDNFAKVCKPGTVIKKINNEFSEKDGLIFFNKKLVAIVECKKRTNVFPDYILEVKKLKHWLKEYPDLNYIYLNRTPLGDYYLVVDKLKIKQHILNDTYYNLDGKNGVGFRIGSRNDRGWSRDQNREWLMVDSSLFKKIK